jgi:hypothetical protein
VTAPDAPARPNGEETTAVVGTSDTLVVIPSLATPANQALLVRALTALRAGGAPAATADLFLVLDGPGTAIDAVARAAADVWRRPPPCPEAFVSPANARRGLVTAVREGVACFLAPAWHTGRPSWRYLVLLEDGVIVTSGWSAVLRRTLDAHPEMGWVACGQVGRPATPWTTFASMMTRACAEATQGPDLVFAPHHFDDADWVLRAQRAGFRPHATVALVDHPQGRTSQAETPAEDWALLQAHRAFFEYRWGIPDMPWASMPVHQPCPACAADGASPAR